MAFTATEEGLMSKLATACIYHVINQCKPLIYAHKLQTDATTNSVFHIS